MSTGVLALSMRLASVAASLTLMALLLACPPAAAAKLTVVDRHVRNDPGVLWFKPKCNAVLAGEIREGDYELIKQQMLALAEQPPFREQNLLDSNRDAAKIAWDRLGGFLALCLSSSGGDIREAIKIGTLFGDWMKVVEADNECASACAVLFMMGRPRFDVFGIYDIYAGRYLHARGKLAFHAPILEIKSKNGQVDPALQQEAYARSLGTIALLGFVHTVNIPEIVDRLSQTSPLWGGDQWFSNSWEYAYLHEGIIPRGLLAAMLATPPDKLFRIETVNQAMAWGIDLYAYTRPRVLSKAMLQVGCINTQGNRCDGPIVRGGSRCLMLNRRKDYFGAVAYMSGGYDPATFVPDVFERQNEMLIPARKEQPWPRASRPQQGIFSQAMTLGDACEIRATWRDGRVANLEIDTFNSNRRQGRPLLGEPNLKADAGPRAKSDITINQLRPWKMLPANAKLADLDKAPWAWLEAGGEYFDRPSGFDKP